jgi:hypothetical protein
MTAYLFALKLDNGSLSHSLIEECDIASLDKDVRMTIEEGRLTRVDLPDTSEIYYYHKDKERLELLYLGFYIGIYYNFIFDQMKEKYKELS